MADAAPDKTILFRFTEPVIGNFIHVIEPRSFKPGAKLTYDVTLEIPSDHPDHAAMKAAAIAVAKAHWPDRNFGADIKSGNFSVPWQSGDVVADKAKAKAERAGEEGSKYLREYSRGRTILKTASDYPPNLAVLENGKFVDYDGLHRPLAKDAFYSGVELYAQVQFRTYSVNGNDGISAKVQQLVSLNRGKRLGAARSAAATFAEYQGKVSDENPIGSVADDGFDEDF